MGKSSEKLEKPGKRREIAGICLLGMGVFSVLSMVSMHAGSGRLMGPGGAATAQGLYTLAGFGAYLLVAAQLIVAIRCFRGRPLHQGGAELLGAVGLLAGGAVLLHLPFSNRPTLMRGPGGVVGQWLGEIAASFIGGVGAGLAATVLLLVSVLVLTDVSANEASQFVGVGLGHLGRALAAAGRSLAGFVGALFPEKDDRSAAFDDDNAIDDETAESDDQDEDADRTLATLPRVLPDGRIIDRTIQGMPVAPVLRAIAETESQAVFVGRSTGVATELQGDDDAMWDAPDEESLAADSHVPVRSHDPAVIARRAMASVVAEVAAVECAAEAALDDLGEDSDESDSDEADEPVFATPIIVGPASQDALALRPEIMMPARAGGIVVVPPVHVASLEESREKAKEAGPSYIRLSEGDFELPSTDLLEYKAPEGNDVDEKALMDMAVRLEQAMANYGVKGNVAAINMGPIVTMYEFVPAPGTRTGKVAQLENDLAMALEAQAVRIVAPIPGKAAVGVEVPNKKKDMVYLKEILLDDAFRASPSKLQVALGKDIKGQPVCVNLAKMPHLLVAGTTGSGKSVTVNGMITSILYNATPEEVRFIMVDPKMLELSIYEGIPHLLLPVVTDPKKANLALRWAVDEMERRYKLLSDEGVRDIVGYNAKVETMLAKKARVFVEHDEKPSKKLRVTVTTDDGSEQEIDVDPNGGSSASISEEMQEEVSQKAAVEQFLKERAEAQAQPTKLPYIVIVIDEFADLMMVAPKDVETSVARIAQKARAAGLHLILATQRPSVDVITGLIKANFPSRIALQVASKIDSRTVLDQNGAETLLGNGDMLFSDRGTKLRRLHGAFLSDDEVHRVVDHLKAQGKPVYDMDILKPRDDDAEEGGAPVERFEDEHYDRAVAIVCETRQASVSYIQRRLEIGYNRAARMVEQMERDGIVGPSSGANKPREVLAPAGEYLTHAP